MNSLTTLALLAIANILAYTFLPIATFKIILITSAILYFLPLILTTGLLAILLLGGLIYAITNAAIAIIKNPKRLININQNNNYYFNGKKISKEEFEKL